MLLYRLLHPTLQAAEYCSKFPATVSKIQVKYSAFDNGIVHMLIFFRTENLPFPATAVTNDTKRRFRSRIVSCERLEKCQLTMYANTKHRSLPSRCREYHRDSHSSVIMTRMSTDRTALNTTYLLVSNRLRVFPLPSNVHTSASYRRVHI